MRVLLKALVSPPLHNGSSSQGEAPARPDTSLLHPASLPACRQEPREEPGYCSHVRTRRKAGWLLPKGEGCKRDAASSDGDWYAAWGASRQQTCPFVGIQAGRHAGGLCKGKGYPAGCELRWSYLFMSIHRHSVSTIRMAQSIDIYTV